MTTSKAVGIDLGTTNSVICMVGEDNQQILCRTDPSGLKTFPSVVTFDQRSGSLLAGVPARNRRDSPAGAITSIKSHMDDPLYVATTGQKTMSPAEVSAVILAEMKKQMQDYLAATPGYGDYVVDRAVVTVPMRFSEVARDATRQAVALAGFRMPDDEAVASKELLLLQEPTAAALYYCQKLGIDDGIFMVYDLGGGTFDVSLVKMEGGDQVVIGMAGNDHLGGDDFDAALADALLDRIRHDPTTDYDLDPFDPVRDPQDRLRYIKLTMVAEKIKQALSRETSHFESYPAIFDDKAANAVYLDVEVTRDEFEALILPLLEPTIALCQEALAMAEKNYHVTLDMVDRVLLVGGSTHIPLVSELITKHFTSPSLPDGRRTKQPLPTKDEPDMAVGYGAAIAAAGLAIEKTAVDASSESDVVVRASFRPGVEDEGTSLVTGSLTAIHGTLPAGVQAHVIRAGGGYEKSYPVIPLNRTGDKDGPDGEFTLTNLLVGNDPEPYVCQFLADGVLIGECTFDAAIRTTMEPSVVLSRSYFLEVMGEHQQSEMVELIPKGVTLPMKTRDYEFVTNPTTCDFAYLRVYEENRLCKQITLQFDPSVQPGTTVTLSLEGDRQSRFRARAQAAGVVVDAQFAASPPPPPPTHAEIEELVRRARAAGDRISGLEQRQAYETVLNRLADQAHRAVDEPNVGKARDKMDEIRGWMTRQGGLDPSPTAFEELVARVRRVNAGSGKGRDATERQIAAAADKGRSALAEQNQALLTQAVKELEDIESALHSQVLEEFLAAQPRLPYPSPSGTGHVPPPTPVWQRCQDEAKQAEALIRQVKSRADDYPAGYITKRQMADGDLKTIEREKQATKGSKALSDAAADSHLTVIEGIKMKWEDIAAMKGIVAKKG